MLSILLGLFDDDLSSALCSIKQYDYKLRISKGVDENSHGLFYKIGENHCKSKSEELITRPGSAPMLS
jgi:hypothetical protein